MYPTQISGGQQKLLEVGRALMSDPKMLLLDEPAAGVSPVLAREMFNKIREMKETMKITFFIIEHRIELLFDFIDYVYVMHRGGILTEGIPRQVVQEKKVIEAYLGEG